MRREFLIEHLKDFRGGNLCKVDTEVDNTEVATPKLSEKETESISEAAL